MDATSSPVNIDGLQPQQLGQVKRQLEDEVEHLTTSFTQLRAAQAKFKECLDSIKIGLRSDKRTYYHMPL
jgi:prefoldin alpha subunit